MLYQTLTRRLLFLCLPLVLLGFSNVFAQPGAQQTVSEVGYLEGRILAVDEVTRFAEVRLSNGEVVSADLGQPLPEEVGLPSDLPDFGPGERVEIYYAPGPDGTRQYVVSDWVRRPALYGLILLFLAVSVVVARGKGLRAFLATATSLAIVIGFVVPSILGGWNPILVSLLGVGGILILAIYFVHGLSWSTTAALIGTFAAVLATMGLGLFFTEAAHLTGFGSDEATFISYGASQVRPQRVFS